MLTPDTINGLFEAGGAVMTWSNFATYCREREVKGVYWPGQAFWVAWGLWNLIYYTALDQPLSFLGGIALTGGSAAWLAFVAWDKFMVGVDRRQDAWWL